MVLFVFVVLLIMIMIIIITGILESALSAQSSQRFTDIYTTSTKHNAQATIASNHV